jgi:hypothetical protein
MGAAGRRLASPGYALMVLGCGHVGWGLIAYREPLRELVRAGDDRAVSVAGRSTLGLGVVGTAVMPRSGFAAALPVGYWLVRRGRELRAA